MNGFSGSTQQFNQSAANVVANHPDTVVIAIDTNRRYLYITAGRDVPLTNSNATDARQAFAASFNGGNYTAATVSSLNSLQSSLNAQSASSGGNGPSSNKVAGLSVGTCLIGLLIIGGLLFLVMRRKRATGPAGGGGFASLFNRQRVVNSNYNQPYQSSYPVNDGPYGPSYGPGYPPQQPPQQQGINPLAAGGLGAAAGGLLGYELGKNQGDRERQGENYSNSGDPNNNEVGAGSGGFFGTSGNNENFGNNDAGGGSGGFFGGNEDQESGSGGFFGGNEDPGSGSGGFFGGNEDQGSGSGGNF
jgi:hypothetical protein